MALLPRAALFDLDDTLFDHTHATRSALSELHAMEPGFVAWSIDDLEQHHREMLELMHREVLAGRVTIDDAREERFRRLLLAAGGAADGARPALLARHYREGYERAWRPVPGAVELLTRLKDVGTAVAVVTNNLRAEQEQKLARCGLVPHVDTLVTSEEVGIAKPDARIFQAALDRLRVSAEDAVMIGDAWAADIVGARAIGVHAIWLNRRALPRPEEDVVELRELVPTEAVLDRMRLPARD
jgi:YjjG family noncanonical pyrimidine nucleotidase